MSSSSPSHQQRRTATVAVFEPYMARSFDMLKRVDSYLENAASWEIGKHLAEFEAVRDEPCRCVLLSAHVLLTVSHVCVVFLFYTYSKHAALGLSSRREDLGATKVKKLIKQDVKNWSLYEFLAMKSKSVTGHGKLMCEGTKTDGSSLYLSIIGGWWPLGLLMTPFLG